MRIMSCKSKYEHIRNETILAELKQEPLSKYITRKRLLYFGHVYRYPKARWVRFATTMQIKGDKKQGRKINWQKRIRMDVEELGLEFEKLKDSEADEWKSYIEEKLNFKSEYDEKEIEEDA